MERDFDWGNSLPLPVVEPGQTELVFPTFCGAILCEVDTSTSSIVVPVDGPCFEYPEVLKSLNARRRKSGGWRLSTAGIDSR